MTIPTEEEMKGAVDNLLRTVERTPSPSEPNFEVISIDAGDFQALVDLARLASTTPTRSQGEGEAGKPEGAGWSTPPTKEAAHPERLSAEELRLTGWALSEWAWDHLSKGHGVCLTVREVSRLISAVAAHAPVQPAEGGDGLLEAQVIRLLASQYADTGNGQWTFREDELHAFVAAIAKASRPSTEASRGGQDRKFRFDSALGQFVNRVSGEPIPLDEPVIIFRARDKHLLPLLIEYRGMAADEHHRQAIQDRCDEVATFRLDHPERLKEPGITRHIRLNSDAASTDAGGEHG